MIFTETLPLPAPHFAGGDFQGNAAPLFKGHNIAVGITEFAVSKADLRMSLSDEFVDPSLWNLYFGIPGDPRLAPLWDILRWVVFFP